LETFGRYQLIRKIATGGMGQIYLARQQGPVGFEKLLVVKRILPHLSEEEEFIEMFFDEARIAAALNHPNIAQIYELGEVGGDYFIAMEYVQGDSIRAVNERAATKRKGGMPIALKVRVIAEAAAGLDFAHRAKNPAGKALGLIHRDVSPQNILVGFNGGVKLIDFGVAKAADKVSQTETGSIKGKYAYMSPEQAKGEDLDPRSDVFGLGIVLHELLTGQRLFKRDVETATLKAVVQAKVAAPSTIVKGIPKALDAIALKALSKKRDDRFASAGDLQMALETFLTEQRMPGTSAHLAAFMRELYSDVIKKGGAELPPADAKAEVSPIGGPKRRLTFDEIADERIAARTPAAPSRPPAPPVAQPRPKAPTPGGSDRAALDARLAASNGNDKTSGVFFNAVFQAVSRYAGPIAESPVRAITGNAKPYQDALLYPTAEFLKLVWKAGETIAPMCEPADRPFSVLGSACLDGLLASPAGAALADKQQAADSKWMMTMLLAALQALVNPAERRIVVAVSNAMLLVYERELLPAELHAGLLRQCFKRLREASPTVDIEKPGIEPMQLRVRW
jgi:uncharacterized protein (TIGR02265 family)